MEVEPAEELEVMSERTLCVCGRRRLRDPLAEGVEDGLDILAVLRGAVEVGSVERFGRLLDLLLTERRLVLEVRLVHGERHRDLADGLEYGFHPRVQIFEGVVA